MTRERVQVECGRGFRMDSSCTRITKGAVQQEQEADGQQEQLWLRDDPLLHYLLFESRDKLLGQGCGRGVLGLGRQAEKSSHGIQFMRV